MMSSGAMVILPALCAVLGLVGLAGHAIRSGWLRLPLAAPSAARLALVQTLALDSRRRVHLIRCDGRYAVVLTGGAQDQFLGWLGDERGPA